jgi:hypothetical protein
MKTIGIIGTRRRDDENTLWLLRGVIDAIYEDGDIICSGGCPKGGDRMAEVIAEERGLSILIHYPNWKKYGRGAGFVRNGKIAASSDVIVAVVAEDRKGGTEDTIKKFLKENPEDKLILV